MKKFFRSFGGSNQSSPPSTDKQIYWEKPSDSIEKSRSKKQVYDDQRYNSAPCLRRSLSFSSRGSYDGQFGQTGSCSNPRSSRGRTLTPERQSRNLQRTEKDKDSFVISSQANSDSSDGSSYSSNVSSSVLDLYIDGEQQLEKTKITENGNGPKRPPRTQYEESRKQKPKSQSFREFKGLKPHDFPDNNGFEHESPRKIAKNVVERLSQSRFSSKISPKKYEADIPITIEDIYNEQLSVYSENNETINDFQTLDFSRKLDFYSETVQDTDFYISRKLKEAEELVIVYSEELEDEKYFQGLNAQSLIQIVRNLAKDKVNLATHVSDILKEWISDRASTMEDLKSARKEIDEHIIRLEKEKNESESALEKELDRRSCDWTLKLEKYQIEEHRLRERVRELAEQNVFLQREVSSIREQEVDSINRIESFNEKFHDLTSKNEELNEENDNLRKNLFDLNEKFKAAEEDRVCFQRNHEEKSKECKDLHKSITKLQRICNDQEKSINGLLENNNLDNNFGKSKMEHIRLINVEQALRKEVESYHLEVDFLRQENINLLQRLKENGFSNFKLDSEIWNRIDLIQNQGLLLLVESTHLCGKLLEQIKRNTRNFSGLESQFIVECEVKLQGFKRGIENLTRSLQTLSSVSQEKSLIDTCDINNEKTEINMESELKAETLLTKLLKEKLHSKEMDIEQLEAELAAAIRGTDILKSELQNAMDNLSCVTHKMKDLELQMMKKDEKNNQLQNDVQECTKELNIVRGILPKVSDERDMMWKEVKQYSEKNMLLNSEINVLKKKIESLDEELLVKEGQITILKDSLGRPFDLLGNSDSTPEFLLR